MRVSSGVLQTLIMAPLLVLLMGTEQCPSKQNGSGSGKGTASDLALSCPVDMDAGQPPEVTRSWSEIQKAYKQCLDEPTAPDRCRVRIIAKHVDTMPDGPVQDLMRACASSRLRARP
jgi:hypothetical protein